MPQFTGNKKNKLDNLKFCCLNIKKGGEIFKKGGIMKKNGNRIYVSKNGIKIEKRPIVGTCTSCGAALVEDGGRKRCVSCGFINHTATHSGVEPKITSRTGVMNF